MARSRKRITRVTTRGGDTGETSLADGSRVAKSTPRIHAIGAVDELNSFTGLLVAELSDTEDATRFAELLTRLQQELFDLGAHLATVGLTAMPAHAWLDDWVETLNAELPPLTEFVIPGGSRQTSICHICRTVCRRAERVAWQVEGADDAARYLNRLSDVLFVMARVLSRGDEAQWRGLRSD